MNNRGNASAYQIWGNNAISETMVQLMELLQQIVPFRFEMSGDGKSFFGSKATNSGTRGIVSVLGESSDDATITMQFELIRMTGDVRISAGQIFGILTQISSKIVLMPPIEDAGTGLTSLCVRMQIQGTPLSQIRSGAIKKEFTALNQLAIALQEHVSAPASHEELRKLYKPVSEMLGPVLPWTGDSSPGWTALLQWSRETMAVLMGSLAIAIHAPFPVIEKVCLSALAHICQEYGTSLGKLMIPVVPSRGLLEVANKAPGIVTVPATALSLGTNPYEMGNEMQALLHTLEDAGRPVVFTGAFEQLQALFHGGQGGRNDPLRPVVCAIPSSLVETSTLLRFVIEYAGQRFGGLTPTIVSELMKEGLASLQGADAAEQKKLIEPLANRLVRTWVTGKKIQGKPYVEQLQKQTVTLAGVSYKPRSDRSPTVQNRFLKILTSESLLTCFTDRLYGQNTALTQLSQRLCMEILTRPLHQPVRYCAQGTPGTGKSQSAQLLAELLEVPYINIDAASIPDYYTAAAQLLGSGRGIVGSYQSGRLEQAAKHHRGAVLEISDLDHASDQVRAALADLFLQILDIGEAQSATGAQFSCANLIFAFTMNLPDGMDESVRKSTGFSHNPSRRAVSHRVETEIKRMLSSAFLSRVGTPIIFDPLSEEILAVIIEQAIVKAIEAASMRLGVTLPRIQVQPGTGRKLLAGLSGNVASYGARRILEQGRALAAKAFLEYLRERQTDVSEPISIAAEDSEHISLTKQQEVQTNDAHSKN